VINSNYKGFQPRVGLAYSPDKHTVIRAGFGLFDDRQNLIFYFITGPQRPAQFPVPLLFTQTGSSSAPYALNILQPGPPAAIAGYGLPATVAKNILLTGTFPPTYVIGTCAPPFTAATNTANCTTNAGGLDKHAPIPYSEQGSLEIDREIGKGLTLSIGYLFVGAHHQVRGNNLNMGCPVGTTNAGSAPFNGILNTNGTIGNCTGTPTLVLGKPFFSPTGMIPPSLAVGPGAEFTNSGLLDFNNNVANTAYHGVTFQVAEKWGKILRLDANYTFSKTIDNGTFTTFISLAQNQFDYKSERGLSNQDARHRFVANFLLAGPEKSLLRHFELSSIITLQSGRPFTEFVGFDSNNDANPVTDRVGTIARNTYTGDGLYTIDLRISRYFQLRERLRLELSVDAFNMLNRPNVDEVSSVYGVPGFCGAVPRHYKDAASLALQAGTVPCPFGTFPAPLPPIPEPSKQFGLPRTVFNPRQFQLAAKLSF